MEQTLSAQPRFEVSSADFLAQIHAHGTSFLRPFAVGFLASLPVAIVALGWI